MQPDFEALSLSPALVAVVRELGYGEPTAIQVASIPVLLAGRDLIGRSETGSGKTAAFVLPIIQRVRLDLRSTQALVLCPTRELSQQVAREVRKLGRAHPGLVVFEVIGGQPKRAQVAALERGVHVVVGTPGRVLDLLERGSFDVRGVRTVVLDEADRMLDMGFGAEVDQLLRSLPVERQTVFFSATLPDTIEALSRAYQQGAEHVLIDEAPDEQAEIRQLLVVAEPDAKLQALCWLLHEFPHDSALVFCNFKASVVALVEELAAAGVSVDRLDGDLDQFQRDQVLARFRNGSLRLLIATDVAGRGIDVEGLDLVINFELPSTPEIYVHRIGRTGRAGRAGVAISIAPRANDERLEAAAALLGATIERLPFGPSSAGASDALLQGLARLPDMATILISGGRKDRVRPGDVLGALTGDAGGLSGDEVGRIEVQERISYVAVARAVGRQAVERLNQGRIKGKRFRATLVDPRTRA